MTDRAAENLALLDVETARLLATCARLTDPHRPSLCEGWDVAHVLTHLARNADALGRMVLWAVDGRERAPYTSESSRAADIESGARRALPELVTDVQESALRFRKRAGALTGPAGQAQVRTRTGTAVAGHQVISMRLVEVVLHHADLDAGFTLDAADPAWVARTLRRGVRQWEAREDAPGLTLLPQGGQGMPPLELAGGGPAVRGTAGQLLLWLARGRVAGLSSPVDLPQPPPWA